MICMFAGQGAQFPGMGKDLAAADPEIMALFDRADSVLGFGLKTLCFEGDAEALKASNICQPAIFTMSAACHRAFQKRAPQAAFTAAAGLSLGEWTALYAAGVLDFDSALTVLEARGRFMQEACEATPSGMISIMGASAEQLAALCGSTGCTVANYNSDAQQVLAGATAEIAAAEKAAQELGLKAVVLQVAGAFHSKFMAPAREKLTGIVSGITFHAPKIPVMSNALGAPHSADPAEIKAAMLRQVTEMVRFQDCVRAATGGQPAAFIEFGPGKVLSGLIRRIDKASTVSNVQDQATLEAAAKPFEA